MPAPHIRWIFCFHVLITIHAIQCLRLEYDESKCPEIFREHEQAFAMLHASVLSKEILGDCQNCMAKKSADWNLKTNVVSSSWTCFELLLAVSNDPELGCATECLVRGMNQCTFATPETSVAMALKVSPSGKMALVITDVILSEPG